MQNINNKISRSLFSIKQARNFLPLHSLKTLYFSLIQPLLTYGILAWGNANTSIINKTTMMQKRAIRFINKATYNAHTDPLYKKSGILKLNDQYELQAILFVNEFLSDKLPASFKNVFRLNSDVQSAYKTRQSNLVHSGRCDSVFSSKLPLCNFPCVWNKYNHIFQSDTYSHNPKTRITF